MLDYTGLNLTVYPLTGAVDENRTRILRIDNPVHYQSATTAKFVDLVLRYMAHRTILICQGEFLVTHRRVELLYPE